jgi:Uma2 family endonuclease
MTLAPYPPEIDYPDSDGKPMAESDVAGDFLIYSVEALGLYFQNRSDVYVSGNLFIYYEEGNPKAVVSPDVFVVFGVAKGRRRSYKVWQEGGRVPNFVLEITSKSTVSEDQGSKRGLYAYLGIQEYFQYDPTADYLDPVLVGLTLEGQNYHPLPYLDGPELAIQSPLLGLQLQVIEESS